MKIRQQQQNKTKLQQQKKPEKAPGGGGRRLGWRPQQLEKALAVGAPGPLGWRDPRRWVWDPSRLASGWWVGGCWTHSPQILSHKLSLCIPANPSSLSGPLWVVTPLLSCCPSGFLLPIPPLLFFFPLSLHHPTQSAGILRPLGGQGLSAALVGVPRCEKMWIQHPPALSSGLHPERPFSWWNFMF